MANAFLAVHGHFYQPPRENPDTGKVLEEPEAYPYRNFNERITAECYLPNARKGNFGRMSFDLGPTLAGWLDRETSDLSLAVAEQEHQHYQHTGHPNALLQPYNHTILPLATRRERDIQIAWGISDYERRFRHRPEGAWLPECAVDLRSLRSLAEHGIKYTVLSPLQAAEPVDTSEPYWVELGEGKRIAVFFYNAPLSAGISFTDSLTENADRFLANSLLPSLNGAKLRTDESQLLLIATDGELYGHHKPFRDDFLRYLLEVSAHQAGLRVTDLGSYLQFNPPRRAARIKENSSWSCSHGIDRWKRGCSCTRDHEPWKEPFRLALALLAAKLDTIYDQAASSVFADPLTALRDYGLVLAGSWSEADLYRAHNGAQVHDGVRIAKATRLLRSQYHRQLMFTSCAFYWDMPERIEALYSVAHAARAIALAPIEWQHRLRLELLDDLNAVPVLAEKLKGTFDKHPLGDASADRRLALAA